MNFDPTRFNADSLKEECPGVFEIARAASSVEDLRIKLTQLSHESEYEAQDSFEFYSQGSIIRVRDCARTLFRILTRRSDHLAEFSVVQAIWDISRGISRPDLTPAFFAELQYLMLGLQSKGPMGSPANLYLVPSEYQGREAAIERSRQLDVLSEAVQRVMNRYLTGLDESAIALRKSRREFILKVLGASENDWFDWKWQIANIVRGPDRMASLVGLSDTERSAIEAAKAERLPFAVTPYYLSLMDQQPDLGNDRSIRAQVIPPLSYVAEMNQYAGGNMSCLDFMKESDTSPLDLITRRYPAICIFKPFNTCPQICVYCQRNWEIEDAMEPGALAPASAIEKAISWIEDHPAIHEVLITGGDPLAMDDEQLEQILERLFSVRSIERIRIGSRVPITMPMRITDRLADLLSRYRILGKRQVAVVTHAQHPYELTPDTALAVEKLSTRGIPVYNQLVYTFYISRRFEAVQLRRTLALLGIDPYYTFNTKGKEETTEYRVPIARLLQEQKEEARLLPGLTRTDEAVYNVPGLGKNYLRARQHRDLISIRPNGARLYEFHPWEKNITSHMSTYVGEDVPILDYLHHLDQIGEDVSDYETIWYYY
ncbi:MAG: KamA family radical SAM protein [candidate division Zixibacteria bacterium]|nr:KamA family radical SAM protein [candidate division Zixibacteria bacterium]